MRIRGQYRLAQCPTFAAGRLGPAPAIGAPALSATRAREQGFDLEVLMRIELHEARRGLSKAMKAVKAGEEVVLTERGKPVAMLKPFSESPGHDAVVRQLEAAGLLRPAARSRPMPPWTPRPLRGVPLSQTIREERDSS